MLEELLRLLKLGIRVFYYHYSLIIFFTKQHMVTGRQILRFSKYQNNNQDWKRE